MLVSSGSMARHCLDRRASGLLRRPGGTLSSGIVGRRSALAVRVTSRYAAGAGGPGAPPPLPPQQPQQLPPPPMQQQQPQQFQQAQPPVGQQRAPLPPRRRVGVSLPPQPQQPLNPLQQLSAAAPPMLQQQQQQPLPELTTSVQRPPSWVASDFALPRSTLMDKEIITRTSGKRLGYINQIYVDPVSLSVVSLYLRQSASSLGATNTDHVLLPSLRQISDVALVHDEQALMDPPADDTLGYYKLVGAEVVTATGRQLGRVRDYLFNPDDGAISSLKYDSLGIPALPQQLFSCFSIGWDEVIAVGPTRVIVKSGTEARAIKENDGLVDESITFLVEVLTGPSDKTKGELAGGAPAAATAATGAQARDENAFRSDPAYLEWYAKYGSYYETYYGQAVPKPVPAAQQQPPPQQQPQQQQQARALPPPRSTTFAQALQPEQQQQQQQQPLYQQVLQQQRQAVPAGGVGGSGWGAPPPAAPAAQQEFSFQARPPQQPQQQQPTQYTQQQQQPVLSQQPYQQAPAAGRQPPLQQQPGAQQQFRQPPAGAPRVQQQQQAAAPPPQRPAAPQQQQRPAAPAQQPPLPQNGIPIIDRTPLPPYRRRDADGNYGTAPPPPQQQQPPQAQFQQQQQAPPAGAARPVPGFSPPQASAAAASRPPLVEPDAVIPGGGGAAGSSFQQQAVRAGGGVSGGGISAALGLTQMAEYRQL